MKSTRAGMDRFIFAAPAIALGQKKSAAVITPDTGEVENGSDAGIQTGENGGAEGTDLLQDEKAATLLIVTKGTLTKLTEAEPYQNRYGKEVKEIIPATERPGWHPIPATMRSLMESETRRSGKLP